MSTGSEQLPAASGPQDCGQSHPTYQSLSTSLPVSPQALHGRSRLSGHPHVGHRPALLPWSDNQALEVGPGQTHRCFGGALVPQDRTLLSGGKCDGYQG